MSDAEKIQILHFFKSVMSNKFKKTQEEMEWLKKNYQKVLKSLFAEYTSRAWPYNDPVIAYDC